jgi:hypothetical protein
MNAKCSASHFFPSVGFMGPESAFHRNIVFVSGKGGVGKTVISQAIARRLNELGKRVLWATFEDPLMPVHKIHEEKPGLFYINCDPSFAFEEYAALKIGVAGLARIFLKNKMMRYLAKAAPGIHELVLLGKVWHERGFYDHVIVDMPSTGYGLAMFQSTRNFSRLFQGGPVHRDAEEMLRTFNSPSECAHLIVSLPEEMPLRESLELKDYLVGIFPDNPASFVANRLFPKISGARTATVDPSPDRWPSPVALDGADYALKRGVLESFNLKIWEEARIEFMKLDYETSGGGATRKFSIIDALTRQFEARGYL